jgi:hypothetical protein
MMLAAPLYAQLPQIKPAKAQATPAPLVTLGLTLETTLTSNFHDIGDSKSEVSVNQDAYVNIGLPMDNRLELYMGASKNLEGGDYNGSASDFYLLGEHKFYSGSFLTALALSGKYIMPTSENSRHVLEKNYGFETRITSSFNFYKNEDTEINYRIRPIYVINDYENEYDTKLNYTIDEQFKLQNRLNVKFNKYVEVFLIYAYITKWNSQGDRVDDAYELTQFVEGHVTENLYIDLGHTNETSFVGSDSDSINMNLYDQSSSVFFMTLGLDF